MISFFAYVFIVIIVIFENFYSYLHFTELFS